MNIQMLPSYWPESISDLVLIFLAAVTALETFWAPPKGMLSVPLFKTELVAVVTRGRLSGTRNLN